MNIQQTRPLNVPTSLKSLRIVFVSDAAPSRNGVGAYYQDLIEQLEGIVANATLVSPRIIDNEWEAGLVLPLPGDKTQKLCLPNIWKFSKLMDEVKPHLVVAATPGVYGIVGTWLARRRNLPVITGFHTSFEQLTELYWPDSLRGKIVEKCFLYSNGYLLKRSNTVLANAAPIVEQARALGAKNLKLVGTPISSQFIEKPVVPFEGGCTGVLFAGRLAKEKNIEAIIEAAERLPQRRFSVAGDGPLRAMVIDAAARLDNLSYLRWLDRDQLCEAVDSHDILILPSHFETFGTIALEAMARQRLVVVSRGCGISDWPDLTPGLFIIDAESSLIDVLERIRAMSAPQRSEIATRARACALEQNSRVVSQWGSIMLETLAEHGKSSAQ